MFRYSEPLYHILTMIIIFYLLFFDNIMSGPYNIWDGPGDLIAGYTK